MAFGGFFPGGATWALMRSPDADIALADLEASGLWKPGSLTTRSLLHVL
jgi:predicted lysophospholipase L1 biosynthesis ABC-type transport system permease subunit